jgi:hypothetical protein
MSIVVVKWAGFIPLCHCKYSAATSSQAKAPEDLYLIYFVAT